MFKKLVFKEIDDDKEQAALSLDCGFKIQIINDRSEKSYNAKMYNHNGAIVDHEEGLDKEGVEQFIDGCNDLVDKYKESMGDC